MLAISEAGPQAFQLRITSSNRAGLKGFFEADRHCLFHFIRHHYHDLCDLLVARQIGPSRPVP